MSYQIIRTVQYKDRPRLGFLSTFLNSDLIDFAVDVQPYFSNITNEIYKNEILTITSLFGSLDSISDFFNNTNGLVSYNYNFINPTNRTDGVIQTIVYRDKTSYEQWQNTENIRGENTVNKISLNLSEDGSFDASNFILNGIVRTNTATGITKELTLGQFLSTKFNILRNTLCTNVHSIIE
jgi:hypothetical protein